MVSYVTVSEGQMQVCTIWSAFKDLDVRHLACISMWQRVIETYLFFSVLCAAILQDAFREAHSSE